MKNINKGNSMKTTKMMLLGVVVTVALGTSVYATCVTNVDMGNHRITNVSDPVNSKDVVNKRYLEAYLYDAMFKRYVRDNSKEVVLDLTTGLMWQDNAVVETVSKQWVTTANYDAGHYYDTSGDTATTYCNNLLLGWYDDWRLPTIDELSGIVKSDASNPSISTVFQHTAPYRYWSSTTDAGYSSIAWFVGFGNGYQFNGYKYYSGGVRCVRDGQ